MAEKKEGEEVWQMRTITPHKYLGAPEKTPVLLAEMKMRKRAAETYDAPQLIIAETKAVIPLESAIHLLANSVYTQRIKRLRRNNGESSWRNPNSITELTYPPELIQTVDGIPFMLYDSGVGDEQRLTVFVQRSEKPHWDVMLRG